MLCVSSSLYCFFNPENAWRHFSSFNSYDQIGGTFSVLLELRALEKTNANFYVLELEDSCTSTDRSDPSVRICKVDLDTDDRKCLCEADLENIFSRHTYKCIGIMKIANPDLSLTTESVCKFMMGKPSPMKNYLKWFCHVISISHPYHTRTNIFCIHQREHLTALLLCQSQIKQLWNVSAEIVFLFPEFFFATVGEFFEL